MHPCCANPFCPDNSPCPADAPALQTQALKSPRLLLLACLVCGSVGGKANTSSLPLQTPPTALSAQVVWGALHQAYATESCSAHLAIDLAACVTAGVLGVVSGALRVLLAAAEAVTNAVRSILKLVATLPDCVAHGVA